MSDRLFLAIPIGDALQERLRELQEISMETLRDHGIKNVRAENLANSHITVRFLGAIERSAALIAALDHFELKTKAFDFCVNEIGAFESPQKTRVLWAGVDNSASFAALRTEIDLLLTPFGLDADPKAFTPHLTLARFPEPMDIRSCFDELKQLTDVCSIERYSVDEVVLYSSKLSPQGATHTKRALLKPS